MKINLYTLRELSAAKRKKIIARSELDIEDVSAGVKKILVEIQEQGDQAIIKFIKKYDNVDLSAIPFRVTDDELQEAANGIDNKVKDAILYAIENVTMIHKTQLPQAMTLQAVRPGIFAGEKALPIPAVGLYVPRGKGSFPSMMYMMAVPAMVAGVQRIVVVSPPDKQGKVDPGTLYAAQACGIKEIYRIGGPMAIAALAYGTESIAPVGKIVGPGNAYVTTAKRLLAGVVDIGLPAGPSDSAILADAAADPYKVALDLLVEAEHGSDSSAILVTPSQTLANEVIKHIPGLVAELNPERQKYVSDVLAGYGGIIVTETMQEAIAFINDYAPEHLQIHTANPFDWLDDIKNAGEILLGANSVFSLANYAVGANAVLPTGGKAKTSSPLSVRDFIKYSSIVYVADRGYGDIAEQVIRLADYEGFEAHGAALKKRR